MLALWNKFLGVVSSSMPISGEKVYSTSKSGGLKCSLLHHIPILEGAQRGREKLHLTKIFKGIKIVRSQKPLRPHVLTIEDNTPQRKILGVGVTTSVKPISAYSVTMLAKALDEVRLTREPLPATTYRQKLKSIVVYSPDEQGMSNVQRSKLNSRKAILLPQDGIK
ncbi:hypothetical protein Cgig2_015069 [Carnegiea gigantea]|uniref:Uncharacterized protein n=1 Tax=Carnegiea gigantea TaxID=171969 RepID=A0A9Q1QCM1_9CARY|nr:hypothetical protein Cgig2_015069 [Carnegiea gigantea]